MAREDLGLALSDCTKAIALDRRDTAAYDSRGLVYLELGRPRAAERDYARAFAQDPLRVSALFGRGVAKLRFGDPTAERDIAHALALDPTVAATFAAYGIVVDMDALRHRATSRLKRCDRGGCPGAPRPPVTKSAPGNDSAPTPLAQRDSGQRLSQDQSPSGNRREELP